MSPTISISQGTFERLQRHAVPLVDNIEAVINRLIDYKEGVTPAENSTSGDDRLRFEAGTPPNVTHTTVASASINGRAIENASWKSLLNAAVELAVTHKVSVDDIRRISGVKIVSGKKEDMGYSFLPKANVSVQGQDAISASRGLIRLAQKVKAPFEVSFYWQMKEGAEFPGRTGSLTYRP